MKMKTLAAALSVLMLICVLAGCTPKDQEKSEGYSVPELVTEAGTKTEAPSNAVNPVPGESGNAETPDTESNNASDPLDPAETGEPVPDQDGDDMEIESGYTVVIDDDLGIGGN